MADQEDEDLKMAIRLSMQNSPPEPKRSKPRDFVGSSSFEDDAAQESRKLQRELMATAAEKRIMTRMGVQPVKAQDRSSSRFDNHSFQHNRREGNFELPKPRELSEDEGANLFTMLFGSGVSKDILNQWCNQGIRFSSDPETSMGLVQHEGGPCGVLAAIQGFVLKHIIFLPDRLNIMNSKNIQDDQNIASNSIMHASEEEKSRALVKSMGEILFLCGSSGTAVIATLGDVDHQADGSPLEDMIPKILEKTHIESPHDLLKIIRVQRYTSQSLALQRLKEMIPIFQSRLGALLFLISALLSRGLDVVQSDRDDPTFPLVTTPFGHASQEIVNLLLCGEAVPNVFDGRMDLGGGMFLKGVSTNVEVGFLTLLESLNFCKVGQHLKRPKLPIWVVGSESHYTVLFALDISVQDENELEERESEIRKSFDSQDQSGGGGFISVDGFHHVLRETRISLPPEKINAISGSGFVVWSEFWQAILNLDKSLGGLKDSSDLMGKKVFDLYHFNGIAKSDLNGAQTSSPVQKPRLTKLTVSVPPRWTPEEYMADVVVSSNRVENEVPKCESSKHAPLVDCVRTRWPRAVCNWVGDPPSIV